MFTFNKKIGDKMIEIIEYKSPAHKIDTRKVNTRIEIKELGK